MYLLCLSLSNVFWWSEIFGKQREQILFTAPYLLFDKLKDFYVKLQMIIFFIMLFAYFETSVLFCFVFCKVHNTNFFPRCVWFMECSVLISFHTTCSLSDWWKRYSRSFVCLFPELNCCVFNYLLNIKLHLLFGFICPRKLYFCIFTHRRSCQWITWFMDGLYAQWSMRYRPFCQVRKSLKVPTAVKYRQLIQHFVTFTWSQHFLGFGPEKFPVLVQLMEN